MRRRIQRWELAVVAVAALLWAADAAVHSFVLGEGPFGAQLLRPSAAALVSRIPLVLLGVILVLSLRGIRLLEDARQEAVDERRRLRELYDYTTDAVVLLDRDLRVVFLNKAAERIGGTRLTDAVGWPCYKCILGTEEPCRGCRAMEVFETGEPRSGTKYEITSAGTENWLEQHWYPMKGPGGDVDAVIEVARDISDRKLIEREVAACHQALDAVRRQQRE